MNNHEAYDEIISSRFIGLSGGFSWGFMCGECADGDNCDKCELSMALNRALAVLKDTEWIPFTDDMWDKLEDHVFYLVAHKNYDSPLKAKFHADSFPHFEIATFNGNIIEYPGLDDCNITHIMKMPNMPDGGDNT